MTAAAVIAGELARFDRMGVTTKPRTGYPHLIRKREDAERGWIQAGHLPEGAWVENWRPVGGYRPDLRLFVRVREPSPHGTCPCHTLLVDLFTDDGAIVELGVRYLADCIHKVIDPPAWWT